MAFLEKSLRNKLALRVALLYALLSILLSRTPLFNYLGYEFSAVIGIAAGLLAGLLAISLFRQQRAEVASTSRRKFLSLTVYSLGLNELLLLIPFVLISLNAFFVRNCSFANGLAFFLLIPMISAVCATALGLWTAVWFRRAVFWYVLIFLLVLIHPVYLTLSSPQLYAYNFFFGYFPGFTYDEVLTITPSLLLSRGVTLIVALTLFCLALLVFQQSSPEESFARRLKALRHLFERRPESFVAITGLLLLAFAYGFRNELGLESSASFIQKQLGTVYSTQHFRIYYSSSVIPSDRIRWIAAEHEFRYAQVSRILHTNMNSKIDSYIYPTPEIKQRLIGAKTTNIAKPHRREIHLNYDSFESSFRHELVHVLAAQFGMPILRIAPNPGLIEGLAVAVDWDAGDRTPHQVAAALLRFAEVGDIRDLFSFTGFATKPSSVSYLLSGSFCRYLLDEYGRKRFAALYRSGQFEKVYREPLPKLIEEWKGFLQSVNLPPTDEARAKLLFARPSIFSKVCARTIADINENATKLLREKKYPEAASAFQRSYALSKNREAKLGLIHAGFLLKRYDSVIAAIHATLEDTASARSFVGLKLILADCYWILGRDKDAELLYRELRALDIHRAYSEAAAVRLESLSYPKIGGPMKRYLEAAGEDSTRKLILEEIRTEDPNVPIVPYLLAKLNLLQRDYKNALENIRLLRKPFRDPLLNFELEKITGLCFFHLKEFQNAKVHLWQSLNYTMNEADVNYIEDLIEYCDWLDDHRDWIE